MPVPQPLPAIAPPGSTFAPAAWECTSDLDEVGEPVETCVVHSWVVGDKLDSVAVVPGDPALGALDVDVLSMPAGAAPAEPTEPPAGASSVSASPAGTMTGCGGADFPCVVEAGGASAGIIAGGFALVLLAVVALLIVQMRST